MATDYYKTLGVDKNASAEDIKKAYRKLAHQHHPDKTGGNEAKFKEINEAYQVLSDPGKRQQYDQFGNASAGGFGGSQQAGGGFGGFDFGGGFSGGINIEDIFDMFSTGGGSAFGKGRRGRPKSTTTEDVQVDISVTLAEAAYGVRKTLDLNLQSTCDSCGGSGAQKGSDLKQCPSCGGQGEIRQNMSSLFGSFSRSMMCPECLGVGKIPKEKCKICGGEGRTKKIRMVTFDIPAGINEGETLVISGAGQAGQRGQDSGDVYLIIHVVPDSRFSRRNNDIIHVLHVKITDALLGKDVIVPTLKSETHVNIPSGVSDGDEVRMKNFGIQSNPRGDQILKIKIDVPKKLSSRAKMLAEELSREI